GHGREGDGPPFPSRPVSPPEGGAGNVARRPRHDRSREVKTDGLPATAAPARRHRRRALQALGLTAPDGPARKTAPTPDPGARAGSRAHEQDREGTNASTPAAARPRASAWRAARAARQGPEAPNSDQRDAPIAQVS